MKLIVRWLFAICFGCLTMQELVEKVKAAKAKKSTAATAKA